MGVIYRKEGRFCCGCDQTASPVSVGTCRNGLVFRSCILTTFRPSRDVTLRRLKRSVAELQMQKLKCGQNVVHAAGEPIFRFFFCGAVFILLQGRFDCSLRRDTG